MRFLLIFIFATVLPAFANPAASEKGKIIHLRVDEIGIVTDGRDTISSDDLSEYIRERLFKNYMGTGKMYDRIQVEKIHDGPILPVWEILVKEISLGQKKALTEVCLHKYRNGYETLNAKQQKKIRKQFPVLFQTDYN